jgi:hypothetical protein
MYKVIAGGQMNYKARGCLPVEKLCMKNGLHLHSACSSCAGDYEDPDRTAFPPNAEEGLPVEAPDAEGEP